MLPVCEDCEQPSAEIGDVVTGAELLAAITELASREDLEFATDGSTGECLVYMMTCDVCGWQEMRSTERVKLAEDPEPIG